MTTPTDTPNLKKNDDHACDEKRSATAETTPPASSAEHAERAEPSEPILTDEPTQEPPKAPSEAASVGSSARAMPFKALKLPPLPFKKILWVGLIALGATLVYKNPPFQKIARGEIGVRLNQITGGVTEVREGAVLIIPWVHSLRHFPLRDQMYRPDHTKNTAGKAPFQSIEGLSIGVDISVRYALDPNKIADIARNLPDDLGNSVIEPLVEGVIYKTLARYTVREIFSIKRQEIQESIENELRQSLKKDGITLQSVLIGKVDLPENYKTGMEKLLAEELASEKMRYTLELKEKQVIQKGLEADAEKLRRQKDAEASAEEQIIAAKAQAEAMKHVLPFKQKQIEQRALEAEAEKVARIKTAEAASAARQIEATGEAESRRKLADAEAYRQERLGKIASEQMERDGALVTKHPLLIQKAMADKLSDKISVIIAPPSTQGGFIGAALLGQEQKAQGSAQQKGEATLGKTNEAEEVSVED